MHRYNKREKNEGIYERSKMKYIKQKRKNEKALINEIYIVIIRWNEKKYLKIFSNSYIYQTLMFMTSRIT
jgi:hypothetical protein